MQPSPRYPIDQDEPAFDIDQKMDEYWNRLISFVCRPTSLLVGVLLLSIATRVWLLMAFEANSPDTKYYGMAARHGVDLKQVVYRDFELEYPPVAWWVMAAPRLIDSQRYPDWQFTAETDRQYQKWYFTWFHAEMLLADIVCLGLMLAIGRRISTAAALGLPAAYTLLTIAQPHLLYDRLDLGLLMFLLLFVACWLKSLESSPAASRWAIASYLFLGLAISFKITPVVLVPFLLLAEVWAAGGAVRLAGRVLSLAAGAVGPFLVHMTSAGGGVFKVFQFHAERGTHLESTWGSIMLAARAFGFPCRVVYVPGSYNLESDWSSALKVASTVCLFIMAASVGLWALWRARRFDRRTALDAAILVLFNTTVLAHVFSPQYLIWLMPLGMLLALSVFPRSAALWCAFAVLAVAIMGLSSWLYPNHYVGMFTALQMWPVAIAVIRSACLAAMALLLNVGFFTRYGLVASRSESSAPHEMAVAA
ncbi:MAG TPA: hypothetical protein VHY91_02365 [Pirellulales bacterium]|jgi:hypothetical protein|nr:hypothetical protein [Pirellulales bacterium]